MRQESTILDSIKKDRLALGLILTFAAVVFFYRLGDSPLEDWDEAIYGNVAKAILEHDDWLTLRINTHINDTFTIFFFEKPPLQFWLTALLFSIAGFSEFVVRFPSALFGFLTVALVYAIGKDLFSWKIGILSALVLVLSELFVVGDHGARTGNLDSGLVFFITLSSFMYLRYIRTGQRKFMLMSSSSTALAILVKGVQGVVLLFIIVAYEFASRALHVGPRGRTLWSSVVVYAIVVFALAGPWHLIMLYLHGERFTWMYFDFHVLQRAVRPIEGHVGEPLFYVEALLSGFWPWLLVSLLGVLFFLRQTTDRNSWKLLFLMSWILAPFLLYTIAASKLEWYILPIFPPLSIFAAWYIVRIAARGFSLDLEGIAAGGVLILTIVSFVPPNLLSWVMVGGLFVTLALLVSPLGGSGKLWSRRILPWILVGVLFSSAFAGILVESESVDDPRIPLSLQVKREAVPGTIIYVYKEDWPVPAFYSDHRTWGVDDLGKMLALLMADDDGYILTPSTGYEELRKVTLGVVLGINSSDDTVLAINRGFRQTLPVFYARDGSLASYWHGGTRPVVVGGTQMTIQTPIETEFATGVRLLGLNITGTESDETYVLDIVYFWSTARLLEKNHVIFVHFTDEHGNIVFRQDHEPLSGQKPTSSWQVGDVLLETYRIEISKELGQYFQIRLGLYERETGIRTPILTSPLNDGQDRALVAVISLFP